MTFFQQLEEQRTTEWVFASERKQRLSQRSLHHLIQQAGANSKLTIPEHPYMLRRSGLFYRVTLLQPLGIIKAFSKIQFHENVIDYLLGAYSLFPRLQNISQDYWLAPDNWQNTKHKLCRKNYI